MAVLLETTLGDLVIDLYTDKCPVTTKNFLKLCKMKYYNNSLFETIQKDYLAEIKTEKNQSLYEILGGEQQKYFQDEIHTDLKYNKMGLVAMSNKGPNLNQADFFITLTNQKLFNMEGKHTIFGYISPDEGKEILEQLNEMHVDQNEKPYYNIRIKHTIVLDDPFEDPEGFQEPDQSPGDETIKDNGRLEYHERLGLIDDQGRTEEEIEKDTQKHRAKTNAIVLEMLGDIADADAAPPENVLFVCKLNQATQESDLELIFSRFGPIKKVEVVRDWKTGQSLQYAFIEFEAESACQEAYFKMENVLIDERRIHVDFCQSVEKLWFKHKQKNRQQQLEKQQALGKGYVPKGESEKVVLKEKYQQGSRNKHSYVFENNDQEDEQFDKKEYETRNDETQENHRQRSRSISKSHSKSYDKDKHINREKQQDKDDDYDNRNKSKYDKRDEKDYKRHDKKDEKDYRRYDKKDEKDYRRYDKKEERDHRRYDKKEDRDHRRYEDRSSKRNDRYDRSNSRDKKNKRSSDHHRSRK